MFQTLTILYKVTQSIVILHIDIQSPSTVENTVRVVIGAIALQHRFRSAFDKAVDVPLRGTLNVKEETEGLHLRESMSYFPKR